MALINIKLNLKRLRRNKNKPPAKTFLGRHWLKIIIISVVGYLWGKDIINAAVRFVLEIYFDMVL